MPKALVEIGGRPILWHVIEIYARQGFERFILCTGYLGEMIERFAGGRDAGRRGVRSSASRPASRRPPGGGCAAPPSGSPAGPSALTYADGVADIDLGALLDYHRSRGRRRDGDRGAAEPAMGRRRARGGRPDRGIHREAAQRSLDQRRLLLLRAGGRDYLSPDSILERGPLERLAAERRARGLPPRGLLGVPRHLQGRGDAQRPLGPARRPGCAPAESGARPDSILAPLPIASDSEERSVKRSLVTGGHGFVASHLATALLARGDAVTVARPRLAAGLGPGAAGGRGRGRDDQRRPL